MESADLREELTCPICLSIYTDPVTLSCGHNFCLGCIESVLGTQEGSGVYTCPECRKRFSKKPKLQRNITLCNIVRNLHPTQLKKRETGISCTYCIHSPVPAAKSCLHCEASLCDAHLRVHSKSEEHVLTKPTTSWGNRKCFKHKKLLEYYCTEDAACICVYCFLVGEHRGHQVELLNEASEKKKKKMRNVLQKLTTKREKTEKRVQSLQEHRRGVQEKAAGVTERLTALIRDIRKQLEDLEKRVLSDITRQQVLLPISDLIQQLQKEKDELTRKICHIEELYNMTDPLTVLQEQESHRDDFCGAGKGDNEVTQRGDKQVPAGVDLDEGLISVTLYRGLADIVTDVKKGLYVQVTEPLLDINTAHNKVIVSGDLKTVSYTDIDQQRPKTPKRFTSYYEVLSTRSFSSGQHYWDVETSNSGHWCIGVCYPSMMRTGRKSEIGDNDKSWCVDSGHFLLHNTIGTSLDPPLSCDRVGILLDYEAGRLSFYELCDPIRHLHTYTATFTEPLHAAFYVDNAWVRVMS
ncbi:E3 ubiquitin/ISG15 ligase TRIM25-like [Bombina bombina]|uniref:E3 ubiquitin/ISG15 ligase TRIM25-like n=1 Tax=Bombina bombina TaxID=8345 RepID=UPI00235B09E3|nr:E3 ubiquitin/ISG15 ligase TRIM25-like [Bombina bombina]